MGISFIKLRLFFHKGYFIINIAFPPLREKLYAGISRIVRVLHVLCVSPRCPQNGVLGLHPSGGQNYGSRMMLNRGCWEVEREKSAPLLELPALCADWCAVALSCSRRSWFIFLFGQSLRIRCFNFFNVFAYRSQLIVANLSKNSASNVPWLSLKTLAMTLPAQVCTFNFFLRADWWRQSVDSLFLQWDVLMNPGLIAGNYSWLKDISFFSLRWKSSAQNGIRTVCCSTVNICGTLHA